MGNNVIRKNDNDTRKIFTTLVLVATLMICTTSATYAYFAISATNSTTITGEAAAVSLNLNVTRVTPTDTKWNASTKKMVPQLSSAIGSAINTTNSCVDGNGNVVCEVFKITVTNASTAGIKIKGTMQFNYTGTDAQFNNLYWREAQGANTFATSPVTLQYKASTSDTAAGTTAKSENAILVNSLSLAPSGTKDFYVAIWIEETGTDQSADDKGVWTATVSFTDSARAGVTSTIVA